MSKDGLTIIYYIVLSIIKLSILKASESHRASLVTSDRGRYFIPIDKELTNFLDLVNSDGEEGEKKNEINLRFHDTTL